MKYLLLASLTLSLALAQPTGFSVWTEPTPQEQGGQVCGTVKDASGNAVEYATVLLVNGDLVRNGAQTDSEGFYCMEIPDGQGVYALIVKHLTASYAYVNLLIESGMTVNIALDLPGMEVWNDKGPIEILEDEDVYSFIGPRNPVAISFVATCPYCQPSLLAARRTYVSPLLGGIFVERAPMRLSDYSISGIVTTSAGRPIQNAVLLLWRDNRAIDGAVTGIDGTYVINGISKNTGMVLQCCCQDTTTRVIQPSSQRTRYDFACSPNPTYQRVPWQSCSPPIDLWEVGTHGDLSRRITD